MACFDDMYSKKLPSACRILGQIPDVSFGRNGVPHGARRWPQSVKFSSVGLCSAAQVFGRPITHPFVNKNDTSGRKEFAVSL